MQTKVQLRREIRERRRALKLSQRTVAAKTLSWNINRSHWFRTAHRVGLFFPHDGEIDLTQTLLAAERMGKKCFLPVLWEGVGRSLGFARWKSSTALVLNRFGIPEPDVSPREFLYPSRLDMVFVPLVGVDAQGNRLGMGSGYYDRSFSYRRTRQVWHGPYLIGACYDFQILKSVPTDRWDVPLDGVVSDERLIQF